MILSTDEVVRFLVAVPSLKHRTELMTAYAAGLRVSEVVRLRVADIDSDRMLTRHIRRLAQRQGEGHECPQEWPTTTACLTSSPRSALGHPRRATAQAAQRVCRQVGSNVVAFRSIYVMI